MIVWTGFFFKRIRTVEGNQTRTQKGTESREKEKKVKRGLGAWLGQTSKSRNIITVRCKRLLTTWRICEAE